MLKKIKLLLAMFAVIMSMVGCKLDTTESTQQFTITYDANGHGTAPDSKKVDSGYELTEADLPFLTEDGFEFKGWKLGEDFVSARYKVTEDITLKAEWEEIQTYTVTFDANGHGTAPEAITGKLKGETITLPAALEADGYTFVNWTDGTNTYAAGAEYTVTENITIKAIWEDWSKVEPPAFSVTEGAVDYGDTVTITCATPGAEIHYTTDGTEPTASSPKYTVPVSITADGTLKAIAIKAGMNSSDVASANYTIKLYTITIDRAGHGVNPSPYTGKHKGDTITLPAALEADGYTFDNWTDGTNTYPAGETYTVTGDATITATWKAWNTVSTPTFSVTEDSVDYGDKVTILCTTEGAEIHYTTGGTEPTANSPKYTAPVSITADDTLKAIAVKAGMNSSAVATKAYTIKLYSVTFDADGHGTAPEAITEKHKGETVTLPAALTTTGFTFSKWNDGTADYDAGATYTVNGNVTIKATWTDWNTVATPVFSVAAGPVDYGDKVTITCATEGAEIFYTTDGTDPTPGSKKYENEEIEITAATTIKAIATKAEMNTSTVAEKTYTIKLYTVTFDADGHGIAPEAITGKHKGEVIKLPAKIKQRETGEDKGWEFWYWNDGTTRYNAEENYKVNGDVTINAYWDGLEDLSIMIDISYPRSGTVSFKWIHAFIDKIVFNYESENGKKGSKTVYKNDSEWEKFPISELDNGIKYTFTITAYSDTGYAYKDVIKEVIPKNSGLIGTPENGQQGETVKESRLTDNGNLKINGTEILYTSEVIAVPTGTVAKINKISDYKNIKLRPFVMSQYEVTRGLFKAVMGDDYYNKIKDNQATTTGTADENPINYVNWFDAIVFCNKLSIVCGLNPVYSYYNETDPDKWFKNENLSADVPTTEGSTNYKNWNEEVVIDLTANGYRLPTFAEWEFCARGGDPDSADWNYSYSGSNDKTEVGWYGTGTNIVGTLKPNKLNLFDMSGNVGEWCNDYWHWDGLELVGNKDNEEFIEDPLDKTKGDERVNHLSNQRIVGTNCYEISYKRNNKFGFRLVRSIGRESN